ncbi:probable ABC transporter [Lachnospiraceae bacterium KM106-2]|nr:probable ABC transporter [Lachnospiraceae bacterium KM106-2]
MFCKIAINNVKKSIKDYLIYFMTLTFGVCLFYVFNSIETQQQMLQLTKSQYEIMEVLVKVMGTLSIFISVILGFLILYANKFLMKRRHREFGIYMSLGMDKRRVSRILMIETLLIGIASLAVGIVIGIFASQGLSAVTAKLMNTGIKKFYFTFSMDAALKSMLYFGIIFIFVMIFNTVIVSKYKLINLLYSNRKNEAHQMKNIWISVILFIVSIFCIGFAYRCILHNKMMSLDSEFWKAIGFGAVGTFLFFFSLSGFLLKAIQMKKNLYYRNLNMFILRQLNSKINTTFISMTLISLMLLVTMGTLSSGIGVANALTDGIDASNPFDANFMYYINHDKHPEQTIVEGLKKDGLDISKFAKEYNEVVFYVDPSLTYSKLFTKDMNAQKEIGEAFLNMNKASINIYSLSNYNKSLEMQGLEPITLKENEYALTCNFLKMKNLMKKIVKADQTITFKDKTYKLGHSQLIESTIENTTMQQDMGSIILPDSAVKGLIPNYRNLVINYNHKMSDSEVREYVNNFYKDHNRSERPYDFFSTKIETHEDGAGIKTVAAYFVLYIGIIFLITCAAILALQQLSESSDNVERYQLLSKLGVEKKMMNRALYIQIFIYFMLPLALSIVHSIVGISVANNVIEVFGKVDVANNSIFTAIIVVVIYGGYFIATCIGSKGIIKVKGYN